MPAKTGRNSASEPEENKIICGIEETEVVGLAILIEGKPRAFASLSLTF
jgi:hypothetical protein